MTLLLFGIVSFALSLAGTFVVFTLLKRLQLHDLPNLRSNHKIPTPRGGGIAVVTTFTLMLSFYSLVNTEYQSSIIPIVLSTLLLAVISWVDDVRTLSARSRLAVQCLTVIASVYLFDLIETPLFQGLIPSWVDKAITVLIWLWFINLYNFMDGIDGITSVETSSITLGIIALTLCVGGLSLSPIISILLLAATLGFAMFNWHPAKIFMGDVGSIPLGYITGWLLLDLAAKGYWVAALIIPGYYLMDATYTLIKRLMRGEKIWQAHSEHFYQQAVRSGKSHSAVSLIIAGTNIVLILIALAATSAGHVALGLFLCGFTLILTAWYLQRK